MAGQTSATRKFLMAEPRPHRVRVTVDGDEPRELERHPATSWAKFANSIDALEPMKLEAYDAAGKFIRAYNPTVTDAADDDQVVDVAEDPTRPTGSDLPIETIARLLADAHRSSSEKAFQFVETAFAKMVEIVNAQSRRSESLERVVEGMQRRWKREVNTEIDGGDDSASPDAAQQAMATQLVMQLVTQAVAKGATNGAAANGAATNGGKP